MAERDQERLEVANTVRIEIGIENVLSARQARSFVRCLQTAWEVPLIQWGANESLLELADARRLLHVAEIYREIEGADSAGAIECYRRAGELLEWLSRAKDRTRTTAPIELFAAAAYQLGGLPAMASGLIGEVEMLDDGTRLYGAFLRADFDGVLEAVATFWARHPDLTDQAAPRRLLDAESDGGVSWYFTVELVRVLGLFADTLRRGQNERLDRAIQKLDALERMATRTFSADSSLLITLLRAVANGYVQASIHRPIVELSALNPGRSRRLTRFARGQFSRGRGILWTSQRAGLDRLLSESSFALCTPTGSGKTLVANLALVKELLLPTGLERSPLALYLVPSRALAGEVEAKLKSELGEDLTITGLYGGTDWGITDYWLQAETPTVLIATVEKAEALMRYVGPLLLARLRLLIVDEAHQVVAVDDDRTKADLAEHGNRAIRLESFVSRLLARAPEIVRIALTAVAGGAAPSVAKWIEKRDDASAIGTRYRSTRQLIGVLETTPKASDRVSLEILNGRRLFVRDRDQPVYLPLRTPVMPDLPNQWQQSVFRFNELAVLWTALHLLETERRILISVLQEPEQTMRWYRKALELEDWSSIPPFKVPEGYLGEVFQEARNATIDYCGEDSHELALLDRGIATNHGQMPQRLRRLMVELIDKRICPITVATATLTEGVNLPFDIIFLTSLRRESFDVVNDTREITPLSVAEFRNLAGRAGRPGASSGLEGMTLVAVPQANSSQRASARSTQDRQRRQIQRDYDNLLLKVVREERQDGSVQSPLALLLNAIAQRAASIGVRPSDFLDWLDRITPAAISLSAGVAATTPAARLADSLDELDGFLLTALEELELGDGRELDGAAAEAFLVSLWQRTFTKVAASQEQWMEDAFIRRGRAIVETIYPEPEERERLYQYGFTPHVGRRFAAVADEIERILSEATDYGNFNDEARLQVFKDIGERIENDRGYGFRVRQTQTDQRLLANWNGVLAWWMRSGGAAAPDADALRAWQRFVSDNLEFRLGTAIGAVVAQTWSNGADDGAEVPTLEDWRETTGLPWFAFWARELLRWGTLDPFVAFSLAQGLAKTREQAASRRAEFDGWLSAEGYDVDAENKIDPQLFLKWESSLPGRFDDLFDELPDAATLLGTDGRKRRYPVIPVDTEGGVEWLDPAGFRLARTENDDGDLTAHTQKDDFELLVGKREVTVSRVFTAHQ
ncbi:DEAD/DEAH box helicase [Rhizobium rhizogenes]|uniref:Helicase ATP-binding domain-containing protein n=1 Tax=Rhizobium rhizogenes NBRC 13257 TaxID=1220581 RepID=A0AA87QDC1_RHIRH|nr:DEAD/DEAH box helicase [Rhizobium rhizogenes]NTG71460.1 DEAD/DEAH box helicase [Rhizobium rhizogenes]NTG91076.1 DEAD/DEAH box helicase [Rhizobium rhizogenes]TRB03384.1 DEAD/DEAH box helicase [Rhizobium rhizogenes]TRB38126.1 DEAD/DEAH box helicase [Rhizobium rhizogenes]TRB53137.1 DEAD/DEAH box helicase [Rhizobium rhizogenes]